MVRASGSGYDVTLAGRTLRTGLTEQEARRFLQRHRSPGDQTSLEESDGYRSRF